MTVAQWIGLAIQLSMATVIFCVALNAQFGNVAATLLRTPGLALRSLLAMLVVMPVFAVVLAVTLDLKAPVELALVASALSPVPPILPGRQIKAGGQSTYVIGLLMISAVVAIFYVPLAAALLGQVFHRPVEVDIGKVVSIVVTSMLLPVIAGMLVGKVAPALAARLDKPLSALAMAVLVIACVPILIKEWPAFTALVGHFSLVVMIVFTLVGLAVGHLLGGPDPDQRSVLALATAARHPAVALAIVHNAVDQPGVMAAVLLLLLVGSAVSTPYMKWRLRLHEAAVAQRSAHAP